MAVRGVHAVFYDRIRRGRGVDRGGGDAASGVFWTVGFVAEDYDKVEVEVGEGDPAENAFVDFGDGGGEEEAGHGGGEADSAEGIPAVDCSISDEDSDTRVVVKACVV